MSDDLASGTESRKTVEFAKEPARGRRNSFSWRGYLTPDYDENDKDLASSFGVNEIRSTVYSIGRNPKSNLILPSPDVSREHSKIHRIGSDFYLEDLGSRHGTYVNGDRILWCRLSDGDILQFGSRSKRSNLWYFDRAAIRKQTSEPPNEEISNPRPEHFPTDQLVVTF